MREDNTSLKAFHDGDQQAFKTVYNTIAPTVFGYVFNKIRERETTEDLVAEAFYKLFKDRHKIKSFTHAKRWVFMVVDRMLIDHYRHLDVHKRAANIILMNPVWGDLRKEQEDREKQHKDSILINRIHKEIDKIGGQTGKIVKMSFIDDKTTRQIVIANKMTAKNVINLRLSGISKLKLLFPSPR